MREVLPEAPSPPKLDLHDEERGSSGNTKAADKYLTRLVIPESEGEVPNDPRVSSSPSRLSPSASQTARHSRHDSAYAPSLRIDGSSSPSTVKRQSNRSSTAVMKQDDTHSRGSSTRRQFKQPSRQASENEMRSGKVTQYRYSRPEDESSPLFLPLTSRPTVRWSDDIGSAGLSDVEQDRVQAESDETKMHRAMAYMELTERRAYPVEHSQTSEGRRESKKRESR